MRANHFSPTSLVTLALLVLPFGSAAASDEVEVGVTAASVIDAQGKPPVSPARDLETGVDVFFMEYDTERAGGLEALSFMAKGRQRVLAGFVTTKSGTLEDLDA